MADFRRTIKYSVLTSLLLQHEKSTYLKSHCSTIKSIKSFTTITKSHKRWIFSIKFIISQFKILKMDTILFVIVCVYTITWHTLSRIWLSCSSSNFFNIDNFRLFFVIWYNKSSKKEPFYTSILQKVTNGKCYLSSLK